MCRSDGQCMHAFANLYHTFHFVNIFSCKKTLLLSIWNILNTIYCDAKNAANHHQNHFIFLQEKIKIYFIRACCMCTRQFKYVFALELNENPTSVPVPLPNDSLFFLLYKHFNCNYINMDGLKL